MTAVLILAGWCAACAVTTAVLSLTLRPGRAARDAENARLVAEWVETRQRMRQQVRTAVVEDAANTWTHAHGDALPEVWLRMETTR